MTGYPPYVNQLNRSVFDQTAGAFQSNKDAKLPQPKMTFGFSQDTLQLPDSSPKTPYDRIMRLFAKAGHSISVQRVGDQLKIQSKSEWDDREINSFWQEPGIPTNDQAYWDEMNRQMAMHPMSDEQKKMLADLESGKFMPKTRLVQVNESKKKA